MPEISVIIPFYNSGATLWRALKSIQCQTAGDFECIMVNNHSNDQSASIAEKFLYDNRFKLFNEDKQGVAYAFNKGLEKASGKWIARMDADDVSLPKRLEKQKIFLSENPHIDVVGSKVKHISGNIRSEGIQHFVKWNNQIVSQEAIYNNRFIETPVINPTAMFRKSSLFKYGSYIHGDFPEDYELWLRWIDSGAGIAKFDEVLLEWHDSENRLTRKDSRYRVDAFFEIKSTYLVKHLQKVNPFFPKVIVWGGGRKTRQRLDRITNKGVEVIFYLDINPDKTSTAPCYHYSELPPPGSNYLLIGVARRDAREQIMDYVTRIGYKVNKDYLFVG